MVDARLLNGFDELIASITFSVAGGSQGVFE